MSGPSISLTPITDERDYELLSEWSSSDSWVYASGSRQYLSSVAWKDIVREADINFLMVRANGGQTIGAVTWQELEYAGSFMIGSLIGDAELWGGGLGMESIALLMRFLFHSRNAHRIQFTCGVFNKAAVQLYCSGWIQIEGVLRDYFFMDGTYYDAITGSILRDEYYALTEALNMRPSDAVPATEKEKAIQIVHHYLASNPIVFREKR